MKKKFNITNLNCGNCANKMEEKIKKIEGIEKCKLSFVNAKLTIEAKEEDFPRIVEEAREIIKKVENECDLDL